jgi:AcrR family transcriptional regulator
MRPPLISHDELLDRLSNTFRTWGYAGATIENLCTATGLKRASLYHHFPGGKEEMASVVLDRAIEWMRANVIVHASGDDSELARASKMTEALNIFYGSGSNPCLFTQLNSEASRSFCATRIRTFFEDLTSALTELARSAGEPHRIAQLRAIEAVSLMLGSLVLVAATGDNEIFSQALSRVRALAKSI